MEFLNLRVRRDISQRKWGSGWGSDLLGATQPGRSKAGTGTQMCPLYSISSFSTFLKPLVFHLATFCTSRLPAPEEFPVSPPKSSAALRSLPNIWHLTGMFPASLSLQGAEGGGSGIMPWFHPAKQSVNKQEPGKHMCRWIVNIIYSSLCGYLQESLAVHLCRYLCLASLLGGDSLRPCCFLCPKCLPLINPLLTLL